MLQRVQLYLLEGLSVLERGLSILLLDLLLKMELLQQIFNVLLPLHQQAFHLRAYNLEFFLMLIIVQSKFVFT